MRKLTERDVTFEIRAEQEDLPVRGNAMNSGDPNFDRKVEDEILERLDRGDVWAWAFVTVIARWKVFQGRATLGNCCYEDEADFARCDYYRDMKREALADLNASIAELDASLRSLR